MPGMPNLHSHAFQRALAGRTGRGRSADGDSFWTWRQAMYAFLDRVDADAFEAIAAQAYVEMLKAGYTAVAEFHYVHHDPQRHARMRIPPSSRGAIIAAAADAGIALTLLPVFYAHARIRRGAAHRGQRRFVHTIDSFARLVAIACARRRCAGLSCWASRRTACARSRRTSSQRSSRARRRTAPDPHPCRRAVARSRRLRRVRSGARPVEWLLDHAGRRWPLVRRPCDAHDGAAKRGGSRRAARSPGSRRRPKPILATARSRRARYLDARRRIRHRQRFEHDHRSRSPSCASSSGRSGWRSRAQRAGARRRCPVGQSLYVAGGARRRCAALAQPVGVIAAGTARRSRRARRRRSRRSPTHAVDDAPRCGDLRPVPAPGARRHGRRPLGGPRRPASARGRSASRAIARPSRGIAGGRIRMTPHAIRSRSSSNAHLATMAGATRPTARSAMAPSASTADRIAWAGHDARPAARRGAVQTLDARRALAHARARRLPHPPRLRRQPRRRIRGAAEGAHVRGHRARPAAASWRPCARRARRSSDELVAQSRPRLAALAAEGVTTVEIKSGYGLDTANERKMLAGGAPARRGASASTCARRSSPRMRVPPEYAGRADDYVDLVCREMIPAAARDGSRRRRRCVLRDHRLHARADAARVRRRRARMDCRSSCTPTSSPIRAARRWPRNSARCRPIISNTRARRAWRRWRARARSRCCCPARFYVLRETRLPPIAAFRAHGVPMAVATDCNPGTSPVTSLLLMLNLACTLFRLTPEEALAGVTRNAARALGLPDRGTLALGQRADLALWDIAEPAELAYGSAAIPCAGIVRAGAVVRWARSMNLYEICARRFAARHRRAARGNASCRRSSRRASRRPRAPLPDTDWHVEKLYAFARDMRARRSSWRRIRAMSSTSIAIRRRRALSRAPTITELCPTRTFANEPI